jgi:MoaA/NifB/PqqE/SkfB family radical SAM enzyme
MRESKYWDDFNRRIGETTAAITNNAIPKVRRVACFITDKCNFKCKYCNSKVNGNSMEQSTFEHILNKYGDSAIIHITGGEPSVVPWLYPFLEENGDKYRFHLNSNCYITPPAASVKRLKVSLDSRNAIYWNSLVGRNAFDRVIANIKEATTKTIVSITYTLTHQNYKDVVDFANFCNKEFPDLYAIFFSIYKGASPEFIITEKDADHFFTSILWQLCDVVNIESKSLLLETIDEKRRLMQGIRFEQNVNDGVCYLSMSERVFSPNGDEYTCSHLYRDGILMKAANKHEKCRYGCNRRLVEFNIEIERQLAVIKG